MIKYVYFKFSIQTYLFYLFLFNNIILIIIGFDYNQLHLTEVVETRGSLVLQLPWWEILFWFS